MFENLAFYKFVTLAHPSSVRDELSAFCQGRTLRGTVILGREGINGTVAGPETETEAFLAFLHGLPEFADLDVKRSWSASLPFRRMVVKTKPEIIPLGIPDLDVEGQAAPYIEPHELKTWLDEGRDVLLVDTRNDYEVKLGTFSGAVNPGLSTFREFPRWADTHLAPHEERPIVTFCTGGIRCEKATAYLRSKGYGQVYQLHGGILKYFEELGGVTQDPKSTHYEGSCFVFDSRVAVDQGLKETEHSLCFACWAPLTPEDRASPQFHEGVTCPHCHGGHAAKQERLAQKARTRYEAGMRKRRERSRMLKNKVAANASVHRPEADSAEESPNVR